MKKASEFASILQPLAEYVVASDFGSLFVFGSLIYKNGSQFMSDRSDLDFVLTFNASTTRGLDRAQLLHSVLARIRVLECQSCFYLERPHESPITSFVALDNLELYLQIHKDSHQEFYSQNKFSCIVGSDSIAEMQPYFKDAAVALSGIKGSSGAISVFKGAHKYRNQYLTISSSGLRTCGAFDGVDLFPKGMSRAAAELKYFLGGNDPAAKFDINVGQSFLEKLLEKYSGEHLVDEIAATVHRRKGGRSNSEWAISEDQQLLLWELLVDESKEILKDRGLKEPILRIESGGKSQKVVRGQRATSAVQDLGCAKVFTNRLAASSDIQSEILLESKRIDFLSGRGHDLDSTPFSSIVDNSESKSFRPLARILLPSNVVATLETDWLKENDKELSKLTSSLTLDELRLDNDNNSRRFANSKEATEGYLSLRRFNGPQVGRIIVLGSCAYFNPYLQKSRGKNNPVYKFSLGSTGYDVLSRYFDLYWSASKPEPIN